jgi:hypothetical protein
MDGIASAGTASQWSRGDHVHPSDTSRVPFIGGSMTGVLVLKGITDGSAAPAGCIGEILSASNTSGAALTSGTPVNITQLSLSPGDWNVAGVIAFIEAANTVPTVIVSALSQTSATLPTLAQIMAGSASMGQFCGTMTKGALNQIMQTGIIRLNIAASTTVYLVGQSTFSAGTLSAQGYLSARRIR